MIRLNTFLLNKEISSLTDFKRDTSRYVKSLKKSEAPLILTVNGKAELVVMNAQTYRRLMEYADHLETLDGIRRGLQDADHGRTQPYKEALEEIRRKHETKRASKSA